MPEVSDRRGEDNIPPPVEPVAGSNPFSDHAFMEHIVRAVAAGMVAGASGTAPRTGGIVTIVHWVKGMREMGYMTYGGEEDAEVAGHWLRKVERVINQMQVPEELQVDCVTQLLVDSAHSWWETIRERRSGEVLRWRDFREEFEERYYSWEHRREKEQEFLDLRQGDLTVLKYERRFQDLAAFASTYLLTERHRVERFHDGLRQELRMILIAMQFQSVRELVRAAQGMKRVIRDTPKQVVEQSQVIGAKRRDFEFLNGRPPLPKKEKSGKSSSQFHKRGGSFILGGSSGGSRRVSGRGAWGGQSRQGVKIVGGFTEQKGPVYPFC
jgi:hypothetical protein